MNTAYNEDTKRPAWLVPSAAIGLLLAVILYSLGFIGGPDKVEPGNSGEAGGTLPPNAKTYKVSAELSDNALSWQGTVKSRTTTKLAAKVATRILSIDVHSGDRVRKGDVIAKLDDRELRAAYSAAAAAKQAAEAQAAQAGVEEKRITDLYQKQAATRQNYDAVIAQAKSARAMLGQAAHAAQQASVALGENVLYAPFDGVVSERLKEPGDMAMPGEAIVSIHKPDDLRFEASIASQCSDKLQIGAAVTVTIETLSRQIVGKIGEIVPEIDPQTHSRLVRVDLPFSEGLQQGHFGWLSLACQQAKPTLLMPVSALLHYGQLEAVRIWDGRSLHTRHIRTGKRLGDKVEVLSGLRDGDTVVDLGEVAP